MFKFSKIVNERIANGIVTFFILPLLGFLVFLCIPSYGPFHEKLWMDTLPKEFAIVGYGCLFFYSGAAVVCWFIEAPENVGGPYGVLRFKNMCVLSSVPILFNIYSDFAVGYSLKDEGSKYLIVLTCVLLYRIFSTCWVWTYFHRFDFAIAQFFEFFIFHEMYRMAESKVILLSIFRLQELSLVVEDLPMFIINITVIQEKLSKQEPVPGSVYISLVSTIFVSCIMTKDLDEFMWKYYADKKSTGKGMMVPLRVCESLSSFATISFLVYYFSWRWALFIMAIQAAVFFRRQNQSKLPNLERAIIWILRAPTFAYDSTKHYFTRKEYKRKAQEQIKNEAHKFYMRSNLKFLNESWSSGEEYAQRMKTIYDEVSFSMPQIDPSICPKCCLNSVTESLNSSRIWDWRFYKVHLWTRIGYNTLWFIVFLTQWSNIDLIPRVTYLSIAVLTNLCCFILSFLVDVNPKKRHTSNDDIDQVDFPLHYHASKMIRQSITLVYKMNMKNLVYLGYELEVFNRKGESILTYCARIGNAEMIKYLLRAGFDANKHDALGQLPLNQAIRFGNRDCIDAFLPTGENGEPGRIHYRLFEKPVVDVNAQSGAYRMAPLHLCAVKCDVETAQKLIDRNADVAIEARHGNLFHMIFDSHESTERKCDFIRLLSSWNCDIDATINPQEIANEYLRATQSWVGDVKDAIKTSIRSVIIQSSRDDVDAVVEKLVKIITQLLWKYDASEEHAHDYDDKDVTILWRCIQDCNQNEATNLTMIRTLLEEGANATHECCPIVLAADYKVHPEVIELLVEHGADINTRDVYNSTLLEIVASKERVDDTSKEGVRIERIENLMEVLLKCGLEPNRLRKIETIFGSHETTDEGPLLDFMVDGGDPSYASERIDILKKVVKKFESTKPPEAGTPDEGDFYKEIEQNRMLQIATADIDIKSPSVQTDNSIIVETPDSALETVIQINEGSAGNSMEQNRILQIATTDIDIKSPSVQTDSSITVWTPDSALETVIYTNESSAGNSFTSKI